MSLKLKTLVVAVAMAAAGVAQAAPISVGGYNPMTSYDGTGNAAGGNVIFSIYDPTAGQSGVSPTGKYKSTAGTPPAALAVGRPSQWRAPRCGVIGICKLSRWTSVC